MGNRRTALTSRRLLLLAAAGSLLLFYIPYAETVVYPFRIFVTFIHEASHAAAAIITGGRAAAIEIQASGNGVTLTRGGSPFVVASAGYIGSVSFGALLLRACRTPRLVKLALAFTAVAIGLTTVLLLRPILGFGFFAGAGLTILLAGATAVLSTSAACFFLAFLALECCLNALFDLKTLLLLSASTSVHTDALNMEQSTGIPALVWALGWSLLSLVILALSVRTLFPKGR